MYFFVLFYIFIFLYSCMYLFIYFFNLYCAITIAIAIHHPLANQDKWRIDPRPLNIDFQLLCRTSLSGVVSSSNSFNSNSSRSSNGSIDSGFWPLLLMIEDEFAREKSTSFKRIHPIPATINFLYPFYKVIMPFLCFTVLACVFYFFLLVFSLPCLIVLFANMIMYAPSLH